MTAMDLRFFATAGELRGWLAAHHDRATEVWIGFHRKGTGEAGITYGEALDAALCFGWIDGVRKRLDDRSYAIRFTPRRPGSIWSAVNIARAAELVALGLMEPPGLRAFAARDEEQAARQAAERHAGALAGEYEAIFRAHGAAWQFFQAQPPSYRRTANWWVMSAKREETRQRRLAALIDGSARGQRLADVTGEAKGRQP